MTQKRFFIVRGKPKDSWQSFPAGYMGIPDKGFYLREDAALRAAKRIAAARGESVYVSVAQAGGTFRQLFTEEASK